MAFLKNKKSYDVNTSEVIACEGRIGQNRRELYKTSKGELWILCYGQNTPFDDFILVECEEFFYEKLETFRDLPKSVLDNSQRPNYETTKRFYL